MRCFGFYKSALLCLAFLSLTGAGIKRPMGENERDLFVRPASFGYSADMKRYETAFREYHFDGSLSLNYEFELPDDIKDSALYIHGTLGVEGSPFLAAINLRAYRLGLSLGGSLKFHPIRDTPTLGDEAQFDLVTSAQGIPIGNAVTVREGGNWYALLVLGSYFVDANEAKRFIVPRIETFLNYTPPTKERERDKRP